MLDDLSLEFFAIKEESERVIISLSNDFNAASLADALQSFNDFWRPFLSLLNKGTSDRQGNFETWVILETFLDNIEHWTIGLVGDLLEDALVISTGVPIFFGPVIMIMADRKNTVMF